MGSVARIDSVLRYFQKKKLEIVNAPEYSLLGGGILRFGFLFISIKRKESPAQRARANRFLKVFQRKAL